MVSFSAHFAALSHWAGWAARLQLWKAEQTEPGTAESTGTADWDAARRLVRAYALVAASASATPPRWLAASEFVENCKAMSQAEAVNLIQMFKDSRRRLYPLSDPLDLRFPLHRQLSACREEVYSDWLQWVLQQAADADTRLIGRILGSANQERFAKSQEPIGVDREEPVEHGHNDQTGRLDIVVRQGSAWLAVVEVKTRDYSYFDLEKHKGYLKSVPPGTDLIFLSVDQPDSDLFGFRFLPWADVCLALRGISSSLLEPEQILSTALILAFVGAVEKNLLGFVSPETNPMPMGRVPRMVDHLKRAARMEAAIGES
jgi:hypothetical protein